ncbi:MAG: hypothetical protein Q8O52_18770 [Sulfuritalea sp.]|nr:hypothetical protein [Sulfuritalea sp.]
MSGDSLRGYPFGFREPSIPGGYDGVRGKLPDWIPENFHRQFHAIHSRLQCCSRDYSPDELLGFVAAVRDMWKGNEPIFSLAVPTEIEDEIWALAVFQEAVRLGPVEGLALLTDNEHAGQVIHGKKFPGRKLGSIGPVRKFIRKALSIKPAATNEELWAAIKAKPPKNWTPMESTRLGRYIERPNTGDNVGWPRFCNIASEERKGDSHGLANP